MLYNVCKAVSALDLDGKIAVILANKNFSTCVDVGILSREEKMRELKLVREEDRQRFRTTHVLKRLVCSALIGSKPEQIRFGRDKYNKPCLKDFSGLFAFNLSHSGDWGGIAVGRTDSLGFDVQAPVDLEGLPIEEIMHPQDCIQIDSPASAALVWSIKEAVTKAHGIGIGYPFNRLRIERAADTSKAVWLLGESWLVRHRALPDNSAMAVAVKGASGAKDFQLICL